MDSLYSYCLLSAYFKTNRTSNYLDCFLPLLTRLLLHRNYSLIQSQCDQLITDFEEDYGFSIPYHPMVSLINRATKVGLLSKSQGIYRPDEAKLREFADSHRVADTEVRLQHIIASYRSYYDDFGFPEDTARKDIASFLQDKYFSVLADRDAVFKSTSSVSDYRVAKYFRHCRDSDANLWESICDVALGRIIATTVRIPCREYIGKCKGVSILLDTPFIIRLLGYHGVFFQEACKYLIGLIRKNGGDTYFLPRTHNEVQNAIRQVKKWVDNADYDPSKASYVARYFVQSGASPIEIDLAAQTLESDLSESYDVYAYPNDKLHNYNDGQIFNIDAKWMSDTLAAEYYNESSYAELGVGRQKAVDHDVESINSIYKLRRGETLQSLPRCRALFLTTNAPLAFVCRQYEDEKEYQGFPACLTDVFLGTLLWANSPSEANSFVSWKLLSACTIALEPTKELRAAFVTTLDDMIEHGTISKERAFALKSAGIAEASLARNTGNNIAAFNPKTVEAMIHDIQQDGRKDLQEEIDRLKKSEKENHRINQKRTRLESRRRRRCMSLADALAIFFLIITIALLVSFWWSYESLFSLATGLASASVFHKRKDVANRIFKMIYLQSDV